MCCQDNDKSIPSSHLSLPLVALIFSSTPFPPCHSACAFSLLHLSFTLFLCPHFCSFVPPYPPAPFLILNHEPPPPTPPCFLIFLRPLHPLLCTHTVYFSLFCAAIVARLATAAKAESRVVGTSSRGGKRAGPVGKRSDVKMKTRGRLLLRWWGYWSCRNEDETGWVCRRGRGNGFSVIPWARTLSALMHISLLLCWCIIYLFIFSCRCAEAGGGEGAQVLLEWQQKLHLQEDEEVDEGGWRCASGCWLGDTEAAVIKCMLHLVCRGEGEGAVKWVW